MLCLSIGEEYCDKPLYHYDDEIQPWGKGIVWLTHAVVYSFFLSFGRGNGSL